MPESLKETPGNTVPKRRRDLILDAAEAEFAVHGFDGVTMRQIAREAGVDVALPNYYYKSKRGLFDAVFLRRALVLNERRATAIRSVIAAAGDATPGLEDIIAAYLKPIRDAQESHEPGWRNYCSLVAHINNSRVWGEQMMSKHFNDFVVIFIDALKLAMPEADEKDIYWGYHFFSGALTLTMADTGRIDLLSDGLCHSGDFSEAYDRMTDFIADGFRRICLTAQ